MRQIYNTTDYVYSEEDLKYAFMHAMSLGHAGYKHKYNQALSEWKAEYHNNTRKVLTMDAIVQSCSDAFGFNVVSVINNTHRPSHVLVRHVICWFGWTYTYATLQDITFSIGRKNHATAIHGIKRINDQLSINEDVRNMVNAVKARLVAGGYKLSLTNRWATIDELVENVIV